MVQADQDTHDTGLYTKPVPSYEWGRCRDNWAVQTSCQWAGVQNSIQLKWRSWLWRHRLEQRLNYTVDDSLLKQLILYEFCVFNNPLSFEH